MRETISDHNSEKCLQKCLWPTYHKDVAELKNTGKYRGILIVADDVPKRKDNITRYFKRQNNQSDQTNSQNLVEQNLAKFTKELHNKLKNNVYDVDDVDMINKVECLTDLKAILLKLKARGVPLVSAIEGEKFIQNAKSLCHTIEDIPDNILKMQYNVFLKKTI